MITFDSKNDNYMYRYIYALQIVHNVKINSMLKSIFEHGKCYLGTEKYNLFNFFNLYNVLIT